MEKHRPKAEEQRLVEVCEYDSTPETLKHSRRVADLMNTMFNDAISRSQRHDHSKMVPPEKEYFDVATPRLANIVYGSEEYKQSLRDLKPGLDHHYWENRHHPEHFKNGVDDMNLVDIMEMLADWKAASERSKSDGTRFDPANLAERFGLSEQLVKLMQNTVQDFGWRN